MLSVVASRGCRLTDCKLPWAETPTLSEILELPVLALAESRVLVGAEQLGRGVRWVHVSELSDIAYLLAGGELILSTGIAMPSTRKALAAFFEGLAEVGIAGLAVELGRRYRGALPAEVIAAAARYNVPLIELGRETPFIAITEAVHTLTLDARSHALQQPNSRGVDSRKDQTHQTLLTMLPLANTDLSEVASRAAALGVPLRGRYLTGVILNLAAAPAELAAFGRDLATQAAFVLRELAVPALIGSLDNYRIAMLLSEERASTTDQTLRALNIRLRAIGDRHDGRSVIMAAGGTLTDVRHARAALREAIHVADTVTTPDKRRGFAPPADVHLRSLAYALYENAFLRDYVERELAPCWPTIRQGVETSMEWLQACAVTRGTSQRRPRTCSSPALRRARRSPPLRRS